MRKVLTALVLAAVLLLAAVPAMAGDVFRFVAVKPVMYEGETLLMEMERAGAPEGEGTLTYTSSNKKVATVSEDGTVTAVAKGTANITATLKIGKRSWRAQTTVTVKCRVTNVTLNTTQMSVYDADDPFLADLLQDDPATRVIVLAVGREIRLSATCTPQNASDKTVVFSSSDEGVASVRNKGTALRGMQDGECELHIESKQNPEISEDYHVLVVRPVTRVDVTSESKSVHAGERLQLSAVCVPDDATIRDVIWSSRNPEIADVDANGNVTGIKRGQTVVTAKAADGSGHAGSVTLKVTQKAESIYLKETEKTVNTGRSVNLASVIGPASTDDKSVTWISSDEDVAKVNSRGVVTGVHAGECTVTAVSNSNPDLCASAEITVHQLVTSVAFDEQKITFPVKTTERLTWQTFPEDATNTDVKLTSSNTKVATVDANGVVKGISRGSAMITATALDGSGRKGTMKVVVTQPVEGVRMQYQLYHIQLHGALRVKALIQPSNANNTNVNWSVDDDYVASVKDNNSNVGTVRGLHRGECTLIGTTEDGGFRTKATIRVDDFNHAVEIEDVWIRNGRYRIVLRNRSEFTVRRVYLRMWCYDYYGNPVVCHSDGESTSVTGDYPLDMYPSECSVYERFRFKHLVYPEDFGGLKIQITGWDDDEGYHREIPDNDRPTKKWFIDM